MALLSTHILRPFRVLAAVALVTAACAREVAAQTLTQEEALHLAFPDVDIVERRTAYLDDAQLSLAADLAGQGASMESGIVTYYVARKGGELQGVAYFDVHRVRTVSQVLMIVVGRDDRIRRIEVVRFSEPPEYRPPGSWLAQFDGRGLDGDLSLRQGIANITGATLTAGAATSASRRVLALHQVIAPFAGSRP